MPESTPMPESSLAAPPATSPLGSGAHRAAGWGAITAALFYLLQPLAVFVLIPEATQEGFWPSPATLPRTEWQGVYEVVTFGGIAAGTLVLVIGLSGGTTLTRRIGTAFGVIGAGGWLGVAGLALAQKSLVAASVADVGADLVVQQTVFQGVNVVLTGFIGLAAFGAAGWGLCSGIAGLRGGNVSTSIAWVTLVAGILVLAAAFSAVHPITGALVLIPVYLVLGVMLLASSRRIAA